VSLHLNLDLPGDSHHQWGPLVTTSGDNAAFHRKYDAATRRNVIQFLTFDPDNPNSVFSCLRSARENARTIREVLTSEMWEHINRFYLMVKDCGGLDRVLDHLYDFYDQIRVAGQQFMGVTDGSMSHGEAWHFCRLGRSIERADKTSRLLDVKYFILLPKPSDVGTTYDDLQWSALLRSTSALEMYRQRHGRIVPSGVVDFLILDKEFPRAVLFCLTKANESLHSISGSALGGFANLGEQRLGQLRSHLAYITAEQIIAGGLHEFIDDLQVRLNHAGEAVYDTFFALRPFDGRVQKS
jgi:uncharacterized alpha-E superfamily protein